MIKIEMQEIAGFRPALHGMRNPMNSWNKSDSYTHTDHYDQGLFEVGTNDKTLAMRLAENGSVHAKYRRMIMVWADITAPLYWWKEFDTYRMGVEKNSCSTMHKVAEKPFTMNDFSFEHLVGDEAGGWEHPGTSPYRLMWDIIGKLNECRELYFKTKDKKYWWQMIQLLPSSYNQKRTVMMSYEALANMYKYRKDHKLDEWREFCEWIKSLPHSELITLEEDGRHSA